MMTLKFLGQNCFLFTYNGIAILSDPFYNYQKERSGFNIDTHHIDYVLITHAHADHIADVDEVLQKYPNATIIGQPEICAYFSHPNFIDINFGGSAKIGDLNISMLPALHTSSFPDGKYGGEACGYMFQIGDQNIYLAGDTGIMADMGLFPAVYGNIDIAILPVGSHYTMCPTVASFAAAELLKTKKVIGCHFDTFPPITIEHDAAIQKFAARNIELLLPELGEEIRVTMQK